MFIMHELGQFFLLLSILHSICLFFYNQRINLDLNNCLNNSKIFLYLIVVYINIAFFSLMYSFLNSDFSLSLVCENTNMKLPVLYKWSALWGNHEGSMLLWCWIVSIYTFFILIDIRSLPTANQLKFIKNWSLVLLFYTSFLFFTSNPFLENEFLQLNGKDLNPILQDPGLVIHPPILYFGYIAIMIPFSLLFSLRPSLQDHQFRMWVLIFKKWSLLSWIFLTFGIGLGSWWAYYELGWGGWWFWDPVENCALMPWVLLTSLLHSQTLVFHKKYLDKWTYLITVFIFFYSLLGTFFVRSGLLTSVHSFVSNSARGIWILFFTVIFIYFSMKNYLIYNKTIENYRKKKEILSPYSRNFGLIWHHILSYVTLISLTIGTLLPVIYLTFLDKDISIGSPYYEENVLPVIFSFLFLMSTHSFLKKSFKNFKDYYLAIPYKESIILFNLISIVLLIFFIFKNDGSLVFIFFLPFFLFFLSVFFAHYLIDFKTFLSRNIAHFSFLIFSFVVLLSSLYEQEILRWMFPGDQVIINNYICTLRNIHEHINPNYYTLYGNFIVQEYGNITSSLATFFPEKRFYFVSNILNVKSVINSNILGDFYIMIGEGSIEEGWYTRIFFKPYMIWLWISWTLLVTSGIISFFKNRQQMSNTKY